MATLAEIETHYSLLDVLELNLYLDRHYAEQKAYADRQKAKK